MIGWIGALLGIAASVKPQPPAPSPPRNELVEKLGEQLAHLRHSREQLRAHVEYLERELATQRSMADHWLRQCQIAMRERRDIENERDVLRDGQASLAQTALEAQNYAMAQMAAQRAMQAQNFYSQQPLGGLGPVMTPYDILRNCSPGRSHALVNQLNEAG